MPALARSSHVLILIPNLFRSEVEVKCYRSSIIACLQCSISLWEVRNLKITAMEKGKLRNQSQKEVFMAKQRKEAQGNVLQHNYFTSMLHSPSDRLAHVEYLHSNQCFGLWVGPFARSKIFSRVNSPAAEAATQAAIAVAKAAGGACGGAAGSCTLGLV